MYRFIIAVLLFMLAGFVFVFAQSQDDDAVLEFKWAAASGNVSHYNVFVAIVNVPDEIDPGDITNYAIVGTYLVTDQYAVPTSESLYPLPLVGQHGKIYYVITNAESVHGTDLLTLTLDFEDDLDSGAVTPELLQEFVNAKVLLSANATTQFTLRNRYLFSSPDGATHKVDLDNGIIPSGLAQLFITEGYPLSESASVSVTNQGNRWSIIDVLDGSLFGRVIYDLRLTTTGWLSIYGPPKTKFWVIIDVTNQKTYPVRKGDDGLIYVTDGETGPNSVPSNYVWCLLEQNFVPGRPQQTKGLGG